MTLVPTAATLGGAIGREGPIDAFSGLECTHLSALARVSDAIASVFTAGETGGSPSPLDWLRGVEAVLRGYREPTEITRYVQALDELMASPQWESFLRALVLDAKAASDTRRVQGRLRSLWGVTPIISLKNGVKAERSLGVEADSLVMTTYYVTKEFDFVLSPHVEATGGRAGFYWLVLIWAMISYDAFFYFNDRGILLPEESTGAGRFLMGICHSELALLRRAEKLIYTLPYGADYRRREITMAQSQFNFCMDCPDIGAFCFCDSERWKAVFHTIAAYATAMVSHGLSMAHLPGSFRLELVVVDPDGIQPRYPRAEGGQPVRILHVPNHQHFKGTRYLETAIARLSADRSVEFILRSGVSNSEVLQLMSEADVVVDQLIGGCFGLTALEAMALGKPVIVYIADSSLVLAPDECPVINANPDTIYDVIQRIVAEPAALREIGRRSRAYVEKHYSVAALAGRLAELYRKTGGVDVALLGRGRGSSP